MISIINAASAYLLGRLCLIDIKFLISKSNRVLNMKNLLLTILSSKYRLNKRVRIYNEKMHQNRLIDRACHQCHRFDLCRFNYGQTSQNPYFIRHY